MIVCVCKSVSDRTIRASISEGADSFDELQFELGVATCCGKCEESVRDVLAQSGCCASRCCGAQAHPAAASAGASTVAPAVIPAVIPFTPYELKAA